MQNVQVADIDRRVAVLDAPQDLKSTITHVSQLRDLPYVVVLGEPGIGKTTVFNAEAKFAGTTAMKVRELMTSDAPQANGEILFLDGLDEYRANGDKADQVYKLAHAISACDVKKWRLSCRSEDWRKTADANSIQSKAANSAIVVVQLLPLDTDEARTVLLALGESDPDTFLKKAENMGAQGFVHSPLSLRLLYKAVSAQGNWPNSRLALFSSAITKLSYEDNADYKHLKRASPPQIIDSAARACLFLLLSGAKAIWRSNGRPPEDELDEHAFVSYFDLTLDRSVLEDALDTALFRGEGEAFEPLHRTIAEYLAGKELAKIVVGKDGKAAFPLTRALALITGNDKLPPTELRGLFAWFATHLSHQGDHTGAALMIERDATSILAYGDTASFSIDNRIKILRNLNKNDPYFRMSETGDTAIGALAGEDLSDEFIQILSDKSDGTHLLFTVFEALKSGPSVPAVHPVLKRIALDPLRPDWHRRNAMEILVKSSDAKISARTLFDLIENEEKSLARATLRVNLATLMPDDALTVSDIQAVLADYRQAPYDGRVMMLYQLREKLEKNPPYALFDASNEEWLKEKSHSEHNIEIESFLDHVLAAAISSNSDINADRMWKWLTHAGEKPFNRSEKATSDELGKWIAAQPSREIELFRQVLAEDDLIVGPRGIVNKYIRFTRRNPSAAVVRYLLNLARDQKDRKRAKRLLQIAIAIVPYEEGDASYWELYSYLSNQYGFKKLLEELCVCKIEQWKFEDYRYKRKKKVQDSKTISKNIEILTPLLSGIRAGTEIGQLSWAARRYLPRRSNEKIETAMSRIQTWTNEEITSSILEGWGKLLHGPQSIGARQLGKTVGEHRLPSVVFPIIAELDRLHGLGKLPAPYSLPFVIGLMIFSYSSYIQDSDSKKALEDLVHQIFELDPARSESEFYEYWCGMLESETTTLSGMWHFGDQSSPISCSSNVIRKLLAKKRSMPFEALKATLQAAANVLDVSTLELFAEKALKKKKISQEEKALWVSVGLLEDPIAYASEMRKMLENLDEKSKIQCLGNIGSYGVPNESGRLLYEKTVFELLAPFGSLGFDRRNRSESQQLGERAHAALNYIQSQVGISAVEAINDLIKNPALSQHQFELLHARAQILHRYRDANFRHPSSQIIEAVLSGGPPANGADLRAVLVDEMQRLASEMQTVDDMPWKRYWNTGQHGKVTIPIVENECRNTLKERLEDRLRPYKITGIFPEARCANETRVDMLLLSGAGRSLPIEIKRHFHQDVWGAASGQLQGYVADPKADGNGIYLVFWFGTEYKMPAHPTRKILPQSAKELEQFLREDLSEELKDTTDIIVFDVSKPI